jgi:hypothetical protein
LTSFFETQVKLTNHKVTTRASIYFNQYQHNQRDYVIAADENGRTFAFGYENREQLERMTTPAGISVCTPMKEQENPRVRKKTTKVTGRAKTRVRVRTKTRATAKEMFPLWAVSP